MRTFIIKIIICSLIGSTLADTDADNGDIDKVNIKALSELHGNIRSKPAGNYDRLASSGDGVGESELSFDATEVTTTPNGRPKNVIEEFLLARRLKTETQPTFYDETNSIHSEEDVSPAVSPFDQDPAMIESETTTEDKPVVTVPMVTKMVDTKKAVLLVEGGRFVYEPLKDDITTAASPPAMPMLPKQTSRFTTLSCFECYTCKTYFLRKIRRCPRGLDMCVKEVAVGRRVAINGRNLIDLEINQYCSTGECPRSDGNITYACCYSNLCNSASGTFTNLVAQQLHLLTIAAYWLMFS